MWQTRQEILALLANSQRNIERAQETYRQFEELLRLVERFLNEPTPDEGNSERSSCNRCGGNSVDEVSSPASRTLKPEGYPRRSGVAGHLRSWAASTSRPMLDT